ncbi:MAG: endonuclease III [Bacillota bacterium]
MFSGEVEQILDALSRAYPEAKTTLVFQNPFELLVATILSAQSTDRQVNLITQSLFKKFPTPHALAGVRPEELAEYIKGCGLYKNKSNHLVKGAKLLVDKYDGKVPDQMEELIKLPGVGRKTANVVLSNAFGFPALAVDTHVLRVANRLGLANTTDALKAEQELCAQVPKEQWSQFHHWLISHGRQVCQARRPRCGVCQLQQWCRYYQSRA